LKIYENTCLKIHSQSFAGNAERKQAREKASWQKKAD